MYGPRKRFYIILVPRLAISNLGTLISVVGSVKDVTSVGVSRLSLSSIPWIVRIMKRSVIKVWLGHSDDLVPTIDCVDVVLALGYVQ